MEKRAYDAVVALEGSEDLAISIAKSLRVPFDITNDTAKITVFKDNESKLTIKNAHAGQRVMLIARLFPNPPEKLVEFLVLARALRDNGASIYAVLPYLAYARQDRVFLPGELVTIRELSELMEGVIEDVVAVNIHSKEAKEQFAVSLKDISAMPLLARYAKETIKAKSKSIIVVSPDLGGIERAEAFAREIGAERAIALDKERDKTTGAINTKDIAEDLTGKTAIIVDDMIATGGTVVNAANVLRSHNAKEIYVMAVHGLFLDEADKKIKEAGASEIITTNTINNKYAKVDISGLLADALSCMR
ncbi:MAG: ribose-phosphate diphosphokinase [Candidatus Micrarchaeia archaeon]